MMMEMSSTFLLSKLKPVLLDQLGLSGLFTLFSGVVLLVILLTQLALRTPHTSLLDRTEKQLSNSRVT